MATTYETLSRRAPFLEAAQEQYIDLLTQQVGRAPGTAGVPTLSELGPQIAGQNVLTQQAQQAAATQAGLGQLSFGPEGQLIGAGTGTGVAGFQPFLDQAAAYSGPQAFQAFMSPYQQQVIDTTLAEFDVQAAKGIPAIQAQAIGAGAFGGGREGVALAEFQAGSDRNRAALQAQLLQQGFGTAQQLAGQAFGQQQALGAGQLNLAQQSPALLGQQIASLTGLGAQQAARAQQGLTAQQQLASRQALQPLEAAQQFGSGVTQLIAGYPGRENILPPAATPSPLATGLGTASTLAGIYRLINPSPTQIKFS